MPLVGGPPAPAEDGVGAGEESREARAVKRLDESIAGCGIRNCSAGGPAAARRRMVSGPERSHARRARLKERRTGACIHVTHRG